MEVSERDKRLRLFLNGVSKMKISFVIFVPEFETFRPVRYNVKDGPVFSR